MIESLILAATGLIAGIIDSIAGGGGLITLPMMTKILGPGAHAVGTNKIVGTIAALVAFAVYWRHQKLDLKRAAVFLTGIGVGSFLGATVSPHIPKEFFRFLMLLMMPLMLVVIWKKSLWLHEATGRQPRHWAWVLVTALGVGFYDGFFGPGGGTFMLLGLLFVCRFKLIEALLLSKLANTISAGTSLVTYSVGGYVHWQYGIYMGSGIAVGAFLGSRLASKKAERIVRPMLTFVVILLMITLLMDHKA